MLLQMGKQSSAVHLVDLVERKKTLHQGIEVGGDHVFSLVADAKSVDDARPDGAAMSGWKRKKERIFEICEEN